MNPSFRGNTSFLAIVYCKFYGCARAKAVIAIISLM
jgi:hypothetical protein